jgi:cytochrome c
MKRSAGINSVPRLVLASLLATGAAAPLAVASAGQLAFNTHCRTCHSVNEGDHRQGPSLYKIYGAEAASSDYPSFSSALSRSGLTWDAETLDRLIANPDALVPGNAMRPFSGIADESIRKRIVDFLKSAGE